MEKEIKEILLKHEERITKLEEIAEEMNKKLKATNEIVTQHTKILDEHTKILDEHSEMLQGLQKSVAIIEDAVTNKIPALFDGYKMQQEAQERLEKRVDKIEKVAEINGA